MLVISLVGLMACAKSTDKTSQAGDKERNENNNAFKMMQTEPDYHKAALINVELGLGYLTQGQVARAKTKLTHAMKLAPKIPETHAAMAHFLEMVGELKDSEREYKKTVNISGKGGAYNNYGAFLCRRGRFQEADKAFHAALEDKEYPITAEIYENAGLCALKSKDLEAATEYLTTALRRDPSRFNALLELVDIDIKQGKLDEAKTLLGRYKSDAEPSARSKWLGIQVAKASKDNNSEASQALMLKNLFEDSPEYQQYIKSEKDPS